MSNNAGELLDGGMDANLEEADDYQPADDLDDEEIDGQIPPDEVDQAA